jgi:Protein of unknown function (DUF1153)
MDYAQSAEQVQPTYSATFRNRTVTWPTHSDLPPRRHARWQQRQKKVVVLAVQSGLLPLHEAMDRYELSIEEFESWERNFYPLLSFHGLQEGRAGNFVRTAMH